MDWTEDSRLSWASLPADPVHPVQRGDLPFCVHHAA